MNWGIRRQLIYLGIILVAIVGVVLYIVWPHFHQAPLCTDNKKNGAETGVDCGGSCNNFCANEVSPLVILWSRSFNVSYNLYSAVAYVENQNANAGIRQISYQFKIYDGDNILITERSGTTFIAPNGTTAIFEPGIQTGNRVPKRTAFAFTSAQNFVKVDPAYNDIKIFAKEPVLGDESTEPKIQARIENDSVTDVHDVDIVAIAYDEFGNALAVSKTVLDTVPANNSATAFFSWPAPFGSAVRKIEVLPRVDPFSFDTH